MTQLTEEQLEKRRAGQRRYYAANAEKIRAEQRAYRAANAAKINAAARAYRAANRDHVRALTRARYAANAAKINARNKEIRDRSKDRDAFLRRRHGMRRDEWNAMWAAQDGRCYLCDGDLLTTTGISVNGATARPVIDHDHGCCGPKKSCPACRRGLACSRCNIIIGQACDDPERLRLIADKLQAASDGARARMAAKLEQDTLFN